MTWVNPDRAGGLAAWNFHVATDYVGARRAATRLHAHRSRPVPPRRDRPPQGAGAHDEAGRRAARAVGAQGAITVRDPRGEELLAKTVPLSKFGGFALDVPLSEGARLGDYRVEAALRRRCVPRAVLRRAVPGGDVRGEGAAARARAGRRRRPEADRRGALSVRRPAARRQADLARVSPSSRRSASRSCPVTSSSDARVWQTWYDVALGRVGAADGREAAEAGQGGARQAVADVEEGGLPVGAGHHGHRRGPGRDPPDHRRQRRHPGPPRRASTSASIAAARSARRTARGRSSVVGRRPEGEPRSPPTAPSRSVRHSWSCAWEAWGYHGSYRCEKQDAEVMRQAIAVRADGAGRGPLHAARVPASTS